MVYVPGAGAGSSPLVYADGSVPGGNTVASSAAEVTFASTYTIPANRLVAGSLIRIACRGVLSTDVAPPSMTLKLKVGGTTYLNTAAVVQVASLTDQGWALIADLVVVSIGAPGSIEAQGEAKFATASTTAMLEMLKNTSAFAPDTTGTLAIEVTAKWSAAAAANTITLRTMTVEILDPA